MSVAHGRDALLAPSARDGRLKVVLYNPAAVFFTMPLALLAIGSELDPERYEVVIVDARVDPDAENTVLAHVGEAVCLGVTVLTGAPISDALAVSRAAKRARPELTGRRKPSPWPGHRPIPRWRRYRALPHRHKDPPK